MNKIIQFSFLLAFCSSCAFHNGMMTGNAVLSNNNFKVTGVTTSSAQTTKVLGIGGLNKEALVYEAKIGLYKGINLKQGEALANISVDWKNAFYILFSKTTLTLSADIIQFMDEPVDKEELVLPLNSDKENKKTNANTTSEIDIEQYKIPAELLGKSSYGFEIGEIVEFKNNFKTTRGRVTNFYKRGMLEVKFFDENMVSHTKKIAFDKLHKTENNTAK